MRSRGHRPEGAISREQAYRRRQSLSRTYLSRHADGGHSRGVDPLRRAGRTATDHPHETRLASLNGSPAQREVARIKTGVVALAGRFVAPDHSTAHDPQRRTGSPFSAHATSRARGYWCASTGNYGAPTSATPSTGLGSRATRVAVIWTTRRREPLRFRRPLCQRWASKIRTSPG